MVKKKRQVNHFVYLGLTFIITMQNYPEVSNSWGSVNNPPNSIRLASFIDKSNIIKKCNHSRLYYRTLALHLRVKEYTS